MDVGVVRDERRWAGLRDELRDLAFMLDCEGNHSGADVASLIAARIGELLSPDAPAAPVRLSTLPGPEETFTLPKRGPACG